MVSTALAFLYYVPVLNIVVSRVIGIGLIGAFVGGFAAGLMRRRATVRRRRPGPVIPIDRSPADHSAEMYEARAREQVDRSLAVVRLRKTSQPQ
jgi:hypothetical protein